MKLSTCVLIFCAALLSAQRVAAENAHEQCDLLIVGGTESGCAAAVQAARMGIETIILVNDIEWLGGQFSTEGLGAIDENRGHGYDGTVPIPRSGLFREIIEAIEEKNAELYGGVARPGNTRVITTARPVVSEQVFRELLSPYEESGRIRRHSNLRVHSAVVSGNRLSQVRFVDTVNSESSLTVTAKLTIDASDWGDVIKAAGAEYDFGIDAKAEFGEPSAPANHQPETDMNPISWCAILVQQPRKIELVKPKGFDDLPAGRKSPQQHRFDARNFGGKWGWIKEDFAYTTRRLVDGAGNEQIDHPDVVLINNPNVDYPLDRYPQAVADALEATQPGASLKNIVQLSPDQRQIIFDDAKQRTLQYVHFLRHEFARFKSMELSEEFGTADRLPMKPYIRESLRLVAQQIVTEQEVLGFGSRSNYARTMFPDAVFSWQFELDFHPTARNWLSEEQAAGPWEADFRGNRRFGRGGTGRAVFPLRSLVPVRITGLLGAQKNLGYTSIVSSSCRLHDQSVAVGQAAGAVAAVSLLRETDPGDLCFESSAMRDVWDSLLGKHGVGVAIWPFADLDPDDDAFEAAQQLALRRLLPLDAGDVKFSGDLPATERWSETVVSRVLAAGFACKWPLSAKTRREAVVEIWNQLASQKEPPRQHLVPGDADDDGISDGSDPLPFTSGTVSWELPETWDGVPEGDWQAADGAEAFNFTSADGPDVEGFQNDFGSRYTRAAGFGWADDRRENTRLRKLATGTVRDGFVFTRTEDTWQRDLPRGLYRVTICVGDIAHDQPGQHVKIEDEKVASELETGRGMFRELTCEVEIQDGQLTVAIGKPKGGSNTTLNWIIIKRLQ